MSSSVSSYWGSNELLTKALTIDVLPTPFGPKTAILIIGSTFFL